MAKKKISWKLPLVYGLIPAAGLIFAAVRWGRELRNLIQVVLKLVVNA